MPFGLGPCTFLQLLFYHCDYTVREQCQKCRAAAVTVRTQSGAIRGAQVRSEFGQLYAQFMGVPFARPPVGELRFCDPQPVDAWPGVLRATNETKACQCDYFTKFYCGSEDCLHLSIYTKQLRPDAANSPTAPPEPVPVMVFFHGGAYAFGSNKKDRFNPEFLLRRDVILVTVNYRLGAFGFLCVDDPAARAPGNAGLKDQVLALRWIRANIAAFGGDPQAVTVFGESSGGSSVHFHLISPMSAGLFQRAIAMSGSAFASWALCSVQRLPERLARAVGWDGSGGAPQMMRVLRGVTAARLLRAQERLLTRAEMQQYTVFAFGPQVEPYRAEQCFLGDTPVRLCRSGVWSRAVPVIFSVCSNEGLVVRKATRQNRWLIENLQERFQDMVPQDLLVDAERDGEATKAVAAAFRSFYFGDAARIDLAQLERYEEMIADKCFVYGSYRAVRMRLEEESAVAPTWFMRFDVESPLLNVTKLMFAGRKSARGACHADDMYYLFKMSIHPRLAADSPESVVNDRYVNLVTEFARTGDPNGELTSRYVHWSPVRRDEPMRCLNISHSELSFVELPELGRMRFWDRMYEEQEQGLKQQMRVEPIDGRPAAVDDVVVVPL